MRASLPAVVTLAVAIVIGTLSAPTGATGVRIDVDTEVPVVDEITDDLPLVEEATEGTHVGVDLDDPGLDVCIVGLCETVLADSEGPVAPSVHRAPEAAGVDAAPSLEETPVLWVAPTAGIAALLGRILWIGPGRFTRWVAVALRGAVLVPLFSRIPAAQILENPTRASMAEYVADHPGANIQEIRDAAGVAWGTAVYHLDRLERESRLTSLRDGNRHRYWKSGTPEARLRSACAVLSRPVAHKVATTIQENPGIHQKGVCEELDLRPPHASKVLRSLVDEGLVQRESIPPYVLYTPTEKLEDALRVSPAPRHDPSGGASGAAGPL